MAIRSILLVDDDKDTVDAMRRILEPAGHTISAVANGREAILFFSIHAVDLVITDLLMPGIDGFQLIAELRKDSPKTPCIAISGGGNISSDTCLLIARGLGADLVLHKPIEHDALVTAIRALESRSNPPGQF